MVNRAPDRSVDFGSDGDYIFSCLGSIERSFGIDAFPTLDRNRIPARALIRQFIVWWRTLEPANEVQREACSRLPGAIHLIDTILAWLEEHAGRGAV